MELKVTNVRKTFRGSDGEPDFSLDVPEISFPLGKVVFIMGHNGSGKSVFLRLLAGDLMPDYDSVNMRLDKRKWKAHEKHTAIVRQKAEDNLALELTVGENLIIHESGLSVSERFFPLKKKLRFEALLRQHHELMRKLDQPCRNLSGGQKQTLAFVAAASDNNALLALDEFLAATDQATSATLREMAKHYAVSGPTAVLIISHDVQIALEDADRIVVLKQGRLVADFGRDSTYWEEQELSNFLRLP